jgi:hypothetical protein
VDFRSDGQEKKGARLAALLTGARLRGGERLEIAGEHATGRFRPRFGVRLAWGERDDDGEPVWAASTGNWGSGRCSPRQRRHGVAGERHGRGSGSGLSRARHGAAPARPWDPTGGLSTGIRHRRGAVDGKGLTRGGEGRSELVAGGLGVGCRAPGASVGGAHR